MFSATVFVCGQFAAAAAFLALFGPQLPRGRQKCGSFDDFFE